MLTLALPALSVSAVILVVMAISARYVGVAGVFWTSIPAIAAGLFFASPVVIIHTSLTACFVTICLVVRATPLTAMTIAIGTAAASYLLVGISAHDAFLRYSRLREQYPLQSLASRIGDETPSTTAVSGTITWEDEQGVSHTSPEVAVSAEVSVRLNDAQDLHRQFGPRQRTLYLLHNEKMLEFLSAQGFGFARMGGISEGSLDQSSLKSVAQSRVSLPAESYHPDRPALEETRNQNLVTGRLRRSFLQAHDAATWDFLDRDRMGYIESRARAAGFVGHRFTRSPSFNADADGNWAVVRVELVSLLKHLPPKVYLSQNLPAMDELRSAPVRALDAFEQESLPRLQTEEDLAVRESTNVIRMLGSLRAAKNCLQCHNAAYGQLLGALSYELRRVPPMDEPNAPKPASVL